MRVLANQFNQEYTELAESHSRRLRPKEVLTVKIQTGKTIKTTQQSEY